MSYNVLVTANFKKKTKPLAKKYRSLKSEIDNLIDELEEEPKTGEPLGRNCYKIRLAIKSKGKGKSGGGRVITLVKFIKEEVHLLSIFDKSEKDTITDKELIKLIEQIED